MSFNPKITLYKTYVTYVTLKYTRAFVMSTIIIYIPIILFYVNSKNIYRYGKLCFLVNC